MHKRHYCYLKSGPWDLSTLSAVSHLGDDGLEGDTFPDSLTGESKTINKIPQNKKTQLMMIHILTL